MRTECTTVLDEANGGMCKIEHIVNAHLVEYGLSMVAGLKKNSKTSDQIMVDLNIFLDNIAKMGSYLITADNEYDLDSHKDTTRDKNSQILHAGKEQILHALNQVFFQQNQMEVVACDCQPGVEEQEKGLPTMDLNLYFVDSVVQNRRGTPLVVAALYTAALSRMGMAGQVLIVPHTQQVLIVAASSQGSFGEKRCFVIDVCSGGSFENVPISQLETALFQLSGSFEKDVHNDKRNMTATNLLRSVDLCIHMAKQLVVMLARASAHRAASLDEKEEGVRTSCVNLIFDLTSAVERGPVEECEIKS